MVRFIEAYFYRQLSREKTNKVTRHPATLSRHLCITLCVRGLGYDVARCPKASECSARACAPGNKGTGLGERTVRQENRTTAPGARKNGKHIGYSQRVYGHKAKEPCFPRKTKPWTYCCCRRSSRVVFLCEIR